MRSIRRLERCRMQVLAGLILGVWAGPVSAGTGPCRTTVVDQVSVHAVDGHPVVTVFVDGEPVSMLLDTGADTSAVTPALAARLGLNVTRRGRDRATGVDGPEGRLVPVTEASVALTGRGTRRRLLVLDLPGATGAVAGLAGVDILSEYELDLDEAGGRVTLLQPGPSCTADDPPPWTGPAAVRVPAEFTRRGRVVIPVRFGAVTVRALLDTGMRGAVLSGEAARKAGLTDSAWQMADRATVVGVGLRPATVRSVRLPDATIGVDRIGTLTADVPEEGLPGVEMLLGNDYLARRRVLVSWARRVVWARAATDERERRTPAEQPR